MIYHFITDVQRNTMSHFNASSGNTAAGSGGQGYGTTGMSSGHYAPLNSTKSLQSNGTIANRMGAFGTHNQPPKEQGIGRKTYWIYNTCFIFRKEYLINKQ